MLILASEIAFSLFAISTESPLDAVSSVSLASTRLDSLNLSEYFAVATSDLAFATFLANSVVLISSNSASTLPDFTI